MRAYLFILITGFIFGIFCAKFFSCNKPAYTDIIKTDTVRITVPAETSAWHVAPEPVEITVVQSGDIAKAEAGSRMSDVRSQKPETIDWKPETGNQQPETVTYKPEDFIPDSSWWSEQWVERSYQETYRFTAGVVKVETVVGQNKLLRQRATLDSVQQTIITNTVQVPAKKKAQLFIGFNVRGNPTQLITGAGPSLLFKTKSDKMIELGAITSPAGVINYQAGIKLKLF